MTAHSLVAGGVWLSCRRICALSAEFGPALLPAPTLTPYPLYFGLQAVGEQGRATRERSRTPAPARSTRARSRRRAACSRSNPRQRAEPRSPPARAVSSTSPIADLGGMGF